ncbi:MAG: 50S ribosomal protein L32e [Candidatus Hodarchaeaceae archaeon]|nr:50S ribosomal protein L32e [Candidatus Hodarchaeaceae archaeon]
MRKSIEEKKRRMPKFRRQEWFRFKKLGEKWRRPRGRDSKMRLGRKGKPAVASVGYRLPRSTRGLHPSGLTEVIINNPKDVERVSPSKQAIRIASGVGRHKRERILARAKELGIRVLNPGGERYEAEHAEKVSG